MPPDNASDQFEWVSAKAQCTVGALYAEWEVRRMALELLFFDEPEATE